MGEFVKVAGKEEIAPGQGKAVEVGGHKVAVFNVNGSYCAIGDACTHQGAPLSDGFVSGNIVTCPWHGAKFDLTSGKALSPPASGGVACYKARVTDYSVDIEI
jgi:nitrite reductase/ring-hydroxylating ferredoxin subunit